MLDQAFDALKTYDWGTDAKVLDPINDAVLSAHGDQAASKALEARLIAVLKTKVSRDAKDYVCRKLMVIGTADSVAALGELLPDADHSHMARYALERIPDGDATAALRSALPKVANPLKVGVIGSLGVRRDTACVPALAALLGDADPAVARAAAIALGDIGGGQATAALTGAKPADPDVKLAVIDASLAAAESLLADDKKLEAMTIYNALSGEDQPKQVQVAAKLGKLACLAKKL